MLRGGQDDGGGGVGLACHPRAVEGVGDEEEGHHEDDEASNLALHRVRGVHLLGLLGLGVEEVEVPHVRGEDGGDGDARQDAHDGGQHQHQTHHHPLEGGEEGGRGGGGGRGEGGEVGGVRERRGRWEG